jgi:hypothetical protein
MFDNPDAAESELFFQYTDDQWENIIALAGFKDLKIDRSEMQTLAQCMRFTHQHINNDQIRRQRAAEIDALQQAAVVLTAKGVPEHEPAATLVREIANQIERRQFVDNGFRSLPGKRQNSACRELFIRHCMELWDEAGSSIGRSNYGGVYDPNGPMVRWLQACADPVFEALDGPKGKPLGKTSGTTIDGIVKKIRKDRK